MYSGTGIYSLPEAARLIHVPSRKIHRWLYGYNFRNKGATHHSYSPPLWRPQNGEGEFDSEVMGFNDLLEVRFVSAFVEHGVPLVIVRKCLENARELFGVDYPLSSGSFKTDGKTIFADAVAETVRSGALKTGPLLDLRSRQLAFREIIRPSLYAGIEYEGKKARRWYPQEGRRHVVLDPAREFGSPIIEQTGTPTTILFASYRAEGGNRDAILRTARAYEAPAKLVEAAIRFEEGLKRTLH